jgi:hypothetical protein
MILQRRFFGICLSYRIRFEALFDLPLNLSIPVLGYEHGPRSRMNREVFMGQAETHPGSRQNILTAVGFKAVETSIPLPLKQDSLFYC